MFERLKRLLIGDKNPSNTPTSTESSAVIPSSDQVKEGWIGVDLDGTLASYSEWKGIEHIGEPIPLMVQRVNAWLKAGYTVKIVTARASEEGGIPVVEAWLKKHGLPSLEVTNQKDFQMIELWDDRAIQVVRNTGRPVIRPSQSTKPGTPLLESESPGETFELAKQNRET